jgi:cell division protein FtsI/penicillin-binding protein 2
MNVVRWLKLILVLGLLTACNSNSGGGGFSLFGTATPLPNPVVQITPAPDVQAAVTSYLNALQNNDIASMYAMLSKASREAINEEDFTKRYNEALNTMSASRLDFEVISSRVNPASAEVAYKITYHTALVGDIQRDILMRLSLEEGKWKVQWDDGLILPELAGGNQLAMDYSVPARGNIYDRKGLPIVAQSDAFAFGIIPGQINFKTEGTLVAEIARLCGFNADDIRAKIASAGADWYLPMCEGTADEAEHLLAISPGGLVVSRYNSRYYFDAGIASQVTGYTLAISPEQLNEYRRLGYRGDERVGQAGIEKSAEDYLAGKHGGSLYVVDKNGQIVNRIGESSPQPADSIYLTIDKNLQYYTEQALQPFNGAAVVLERDTGRVLAMASSPDFDPNLFESTNPNNVKLTDLLNDTNQPLVNRAAQGQYPLGSVFKIITFSAALESGLYVKDTEYNCQYDFAELQQYGGPVLHDWTWDHCQEALQAGGQCNTSSTTPSGKLNLQQGLMRSCNPYFWHIGLDLYANWDRKTDISKMARAFGLGAPTGIEQVAEASGQIVDPTNEIDATNQAIGQGKVQVTPLQVADFVAAIGNGGTLYRPQLIEKIQPVEGNPVSIFKPEARGTLPLNPENLKILQEAMTMVVKDPRGTANYRLRGLQFPVAGKTGTATSGSGKPHAWFTGYTMAASSTNLPDIAVAIIIENIGEGSDYAAPIFKAIVETYYLGTPQSRPWFGPIGGPLNTPTPLGGIPTKTKKP